MNEREVENYLESILHVKKWNDNVSDPNRNVYRQSPRTKEEIECKRKTEPTLRTR